MDEAVICFPIRADLPLAPVDELLLISKKTGLGAGLYNGPGGKVESDESPRTAAIRETREEVGLDVHDPDRRAELEFYFGEDPLFRCHVYVATAFSGSATESREAVPEWRRRDAIPYDEMWEDDRLWLPEVLDGAFVEGVFEFDADGDELLAWDVAVEE